MDPDDSGSFEAYVEDEQLSGDIVGCLNDISEADNGRATAISFETADPYEYESLVGSALRNLGWNASVTSGSGDQGADVIAEYGNYKLVIQCKLYSQPVGNKAVQEVAAAKGFYNANIAAVVTNHSFTKSAKQLASSLDVYLVHHDQLDQLSQNFIETAPDTSVKQGADFNSDFRTLIHQLLIENDWVTADDQEEPDEIDDILREFETFSFDIAVRGEEELLICCPVSGVPVSLEDMYSIEETASSFASDDHSKVIIASRHGFEDEVISYAESIPYIELINQSDTSLIKSLINNH